MLDRDEELIAQVRRANPEFDRLFQEHQTFEEQVEKFQKLRYLTPEQEVEKKRLKKLKLRGKDRMAELLREYEQQMGVK